MTDYTPTEAEVRGVYIEQSENADFPTEAWYQAWKKGGGAEGEWDRFIAKVKADALREASDAWSPDDYGPYVRSYLETRADAYEKGVTND